MFKSSGLDNPHCNRVLIENICATVISLKVIHKSGLTTVEDKMQTRAKKS